MKVTIQLEECEVIVEGDYIPAEYGERDAEGQQLEQDWPAEFLVTSFTLVYTRTGYGGHKTTTKIVDEDLPVGLIHSKFYDDLEAAVLDKLAKEHHA